MSLSFFGCLTLLLLPTNSDDRRLEALPYQQGEPGRPVSVNAAPQCDGREEREGGARAEAEEEEDPAEEEGDRRKKRE